MVTPVTSDRGLLTQIVEQSRIGIIVTSVGDDQRILYANQAFLELTGYAMDEVIGRNCRFLQGANTAPDAIAELRDAMDNGRTVVVELLNYRKDGTEFWNQLHVHPILGADGQPQYMLGYQRDVTQRRNLEQGLQQVRRLEALGVLTGGIAHEFNNLLQVMTSTLDMIEYQVGPGEGRAERIAAPIDSGRAAIARVEALTRQLQTFARGRPGATATAQVNEVIESLREILTKALGEAVQVEFDLEATVGSCCIDRVLAETCLVNIAINAKEAMEGCADRRLLIRTGRRDMETDQAQAYRIEPGVYFAIELIDSGRGMDAATLERACDPFFSTKGSLGVGLGLSTAYGFARQSGGTLTLHSEVGKGTRVTLLLPAVNPEVTAGADAGTAQASPRATKLLLVDDRDDLVFVVRDMLRVEGFEVTTANDASQALARFENEGTFDLMLSDVVMPGEMDGFALARMVRERYPTTRILLMSGFTGRELGPEAAEFDLIAKPFRFPELLSRIRTTLAARHADVDRATVADAS
ncbi:PAS domain-containing protein [Lysobacter arvi]|uniref:histidine kinase n=1 Tax=Lysobacter arvi TaxID=3038776 RepID=A0ABU1CB31_9GAMM|nr:PAS domain-containing protein [Lysobacter arvi]MDR0181952.1 PAS domain-containing protein [Lysobacter arvi]